MDFCLQFERFSNLAVHHGNMGVGFLFNGRELVLAHIMWQVVLGGGDAGWWWWWWGLPQYPV